MTALETAARQGIADRLSDREPGDERAHDRRGGPGLVGDLGNDGRDDAVARGIERREREQDQIGHRGQTPPSASAMSA